LKHRLRPPDIPVGHGAAGSSEGACCNAKSQLARLARLARRASLPRGRR